MLSIEDVKVAFVKFSVTGTLLSLTFGAVIVNIASCRPLASLPFAGSTYTDAMAGVVPLVGVTPSHAALAVAFQFAARLGAVNLTGAAAMGAPLMPLKVIWP
ncbi:hypothetical protein D9M09_21100 [Janthinobacterium agaricidamnosum]|uniref:Uncharacterized protein n=1 Tax=Janthinobacterium agaricidamnosum TaxID=55508 RepID=A0A3G2EEE4_9BURK|nr:hypothetical protein D9M09_21100 [Janthinobacterium agaricidamnosum]